MSDLQIPAEAEAVAHAFGVSPQILADTAPFIVAAELRRLAEDGRGRGWKTAERVLIALRRRADELDGGGS